MIDAWDNALHDSIRSANSSRGFCVAKSLAESSSSLCCDEVSSKSPLGLLSDADQCFHATSNQSSVTPLCIPLLESIALSTECNQVHDCKGEEICLVPYIPHPNLSVVRLHIGDPWKLVPRQYFTLSADGYIVSDDQDRFKKDRVVVFIGDARTLWDDVRVGCVLPRWNLFPFEIPYIIERMLQYVVLLTKVLSFPSLWLCLYSIFFQFTDWTASTFWLQ